MPINKGMNEAYVEYFSLEEYVSKIKLLPQIIEHLEYTNSEFDNFMKALSRYDQNYISDFFIKSLYMELKSNQAIENHGFDISLINNESLLFNTLSISNKRIHDLHNFSIKEEIEKGVYEKTDSYRQNEVHVSRYNYDKQKEEIFWRGAMAKDLTKFMNDFIKVYRYAGLSFLYSSPFLFSALTHLLFVRIHPYSDGNGRTARILHNIKFTEMLNKLYGTRLKISPLNLSKSILINRKTYVDRLNSIYFDLEHDSNTDINKWFEFVLNMADEQIYYASNRVGKIDSSYLSEEEEDIDLEIPSLETMRLSRIKKIHE